jgi:spore maturation protein CgeB
MASDLTLFQQNLEVLCVHAPQAASSIQAGPGLFDVRIEPLLEGDQALIRYDREGSGRTVHRKERYYREQVVADVNTALLQLRHRGVSGCVLYGIDAGARVRLLFEQTQYNYPLFIVEKHVAYIIAVMHAFDLRELFKSKRFFLFVGERAAGDMAGFLRNEHSMFLPLERLCCYPEEDRDFYEAAQQNVEQTLRYLFDEHRAASQRVQGYYRQRSMDDLQKRFDPAHRSSLRVLGDACTDTTFLQYAVRDAIEAFQSLGVQTRVIHTDTGCVSGSYVYRLLEGFYPDLWFRINHVAKEYFFLSDNLITVSWIQDYMPFLFDAKISFTEKIGRYDQLIVMARHFIDDLRQAGFPEEKLHYFHHGSNTRLYHPVSLSAEDRARYGADISFVSHYRDYTQVYSLLDQRVADALYSRMAEEEVFYPEDVVPLLRQIEEKFAAAPVDEELFRVKIWPPLAAAALRHPYLESVKDYGLRIFGKGWDSDRRFSACAAGSADNGEEVCKVYNAGKININLHPATNNHARIFDCLASGGFMLTWWTHEDDQAGGLADLFEVGKEIEVFRSKEELREKVCYYLQHDDIRRSVALKGYERVLREHTYAHRMRQVLDIVGQGFTHAG